MPSFSAYSSLKETTGGKQNDKPNVCLLGIINTKLRHIIGFLSIIIRSDNENTNKFYAVDSNRSALIYRVWAKKHA
ncbi:MAG: hypothetical protein K0R59_2356 [Sphingobacterium sp.]|jgi:hypothetical protein|nr:hypothetical protein [Sphingobacterium sp.]